MKQYVIDQLRETDYDKIRSYLDANTEKAPLDGVYRVMLPQELYTDLQHEHASCQPYYFSVNLSLRELQIEWLVRSLQVIRCGCIAYATRPQRDFIIDFGDKMLEELDLRL